MTRWKVEKAQVLHYDENCKVRFGPAWRVISPAGMPWGNYPTHAEAQAYADRMARTREYVLPRPNSAWFERPVWELGDGVTVYQSIGDQSQTITADYPRIAIPNSKRRELALALLALAEQEEHA